MKILFRTRLGQISIRQNLTIETRKRLNRIEKSNQPRPTPPRTGQMEAF